MVVADVVASSRSACLSVSEPLTVRPKARFQLLTTLFGPAAPSLPIAAKPSGVAAAWLLAMRAARLLVHTTNQSKVASSTLHQASDRRVRLGMRIAVLLNEDD